MTSLVETTGQFQLVDPATRAQVPHGRPAVVPHTHFVHVRVNVGQLNLLAGDLPEEASDAEFAAFWKEAKGDKPLAVASFLASLAPKPAENDPAPAPKGKK